MILHARSDKVSSFLDAQSIVATIQSCGGSVDFVIVDDANSYPNRKSGVNNSGHNYFKYVMLDASSEEVLYSRLRNILSLARWRPSYLNCIFDC